MTDANTTQSELQYPASSKTLRLAFLAFMSSLSLFPAMFIAYSKTNADADDEPDAYGYEHLPRGYRFEDAKTSRLYIEGNQLAVKALKRATLYTTTGFGLFCFFSWVMLGTPIDKRELRLRIGQYLPKITPNEKND
ncbi:hypothetical protein ACOME3_003884 [Neoechinorhynchus agilis]